MIETILLLGRPGSGKTTAFHQIKRHFEDQEWDVIRVRDYDLLHDLFLADTTNQKFKPNTGGGFDVVDYSVLDDVLKEIEQKIALIRKMSAKKKTIITIEFGRYDYAASLQLFSPVFLKSTHILYINTDVQTCIKRIHNRVATAKTDDDHFISEDILLNFYIKENKTYIENEIKNDAMPNIIIECVDNLDSLENFHRQIQRFANNVCKISSDKNNVTIKEKQIFEKEIVSRMFVVVLILILVVVLKKQIRLNV